MYLSKLNILIVDDEEEIRFLLNRFLQKYSKKIFVASNGHQALKIYKENDIDIIITDIRMPIINGIELLKEIKKINSEQTVVLFSGSNDYDFLLEAINNGADKFFIKPLNFESMLSSLEAIAKKIIAQKENIEYRNILSQDVYKLTKELNDLNKQIVYMLGSVAESRTIETATHLKRVTSYSKILAKYTDLNDEDIKLLSYATPLHDIGKIATPNSILQKNGKLSLEEFEIIKTHTTIGHKILSSIDNKIFVTAADIALTHHEKYDGSGYPYGLKGENISFFGRIVAVADVFDALTSSRSYKDEWGLERTIEIMKPQRAKHFDPQIYDIFFDHLDELVECKKSLAEI
ncbi:MAG: response regulator [Arcobacteraceae bacterium]|nr:response regulator [Arcobacteraceae bacterium]